MGLAQVAQVGQGGRVAGLGEVVVDIFQRGLQREYLAVLGGRLAAFHQPPLEFRHHGQRIQPDHLLGFRVVLLGFLQQGVAQKVQAGIAAGGDFHTLRLPEKFPCYGVESGFDDVKIIRTNDTSVSFFADCSDIISSYNILINNIAVITTKIKLSNKSKTPP